jgi:putative ATPase
MPEARIILSQTTIYLANSPKSNSAYMAINDAMSYVKQSGNLPVPLHLRNAPTKLMKKMGYGADYQYSHNGVGNFIKQEYLPEKISGKLFYEPGKNAAEEKSREFLRKRWKEKYGY